MKLVVIRASMFATVAAVTFAVVGLSPGVAAAKGASCGPRIAGEGMGTGVSGAGTRNAKAAAMENWTQNVQARYGNRFGSRPTARGLRSDCRGGVVLQAKCTISAMPCR